MFTICNLYNSIENKNETEKCSTKLPNEIKCETQFCLATPSPFPLPTLPPHPITCQALVLVLFVAILVVVVAVLRVNAQRFHLTVCVIWGHAPILPISQCVSASAAACVFAFAWRLAVQVN